MKKQRPKASGRSPAGARRSPEGAGPRRKAGKAPTAHRGQRADARQNRGKLLEAAQALFALQGVSVPIDEIARRAGVGPGTLYRHFPSKEALFKAIVIERMQGLLQQSRQLAGGVEPGTAFFAFLQRVVKEGVANRALVDALARMDYDLKTRNSEETKEIWSVMERLLSRAQSAGAVRKQVRIADVFVLVTAVVRASDTKSSDPAQRSRLFAILADGMKSPGDTRRPATTPARARTSSAVSQTG